MVCMKYYSELGNTKLGVLLGLAAIALAGGATYSMVKSTRLELKAAGVSLQIINRLTEISETNQELEQSIDLLKRNKAVSPKTITRLENTIDRNKEKIQSTETKLSETIDKLTDANSQELPTTSFE